MISVEPAQNLTETRPQLDDHVIPIGDVVKLHPSLVDKFEDAEEATYDARVKAERDIDYYDGKQWTSAEAAELKKRGQPVIAMNEVRPKIDFLQGLEKTQRSVPEAKPRTPKHEDEAHAATDALRFVADDNQYDDKRSSVWKDLLKAGWGGLEIIVEPKAQNLMSTTALSQPEYNIVIRRTAWDRMFWDPHSSEEDFSDARYLGLVCWMDRDEAVQRYGKEAERVLELTFSASDSQTFDDKPKRTYWVDNQNRKRARIVQLWMSDANGVWSYYEFTKGGMLKWGRSPYMTEDGETEHPFVFNSAYVDRDNNRYGPIRDLIDPQDEMNKRRSKALHQATTRQTYASEGSISANMTKREMRRQLTRPDGHIELAPTKEFGRDFGIIPTTDQTGEQFQLMQETKAYIQSAGPNAALQGRQQEGQSGRAILASQQGGAVQMGTLTDTLRVIDMQAYRKIWRRIRQYWTGEMWIRVTDDEKNLKWVGLNQPATQQVPNPYNGQPVEMPIIDPQTGQQILNNKVAELDVDIEISEAPDMGTLQQEEYAQLTQLAGSGFPIPPEVIIKASNLRSKADLLKMMDEAKQQQMQASQQPPNPLQQAAAELELQGKQANNEKTMAQTGQIKADTVHKMVDAHVKVNPQPQIFNPQLPPQMMPGQQY